MRLRTRRTRPADADRIRLRTVPRPDPASLGFTIEQLNKELDRALEARRTVDTRAAVIPGVVGAVAGVTADGISSSLDFPLQVVLVVVAAVALLAVALSFVSIAATVYSVGPSAVEMAARTAEPLDRHRQATANELAIAIRDLSERVQRKSRLFNSSLLLAAVAGVGLFAFGIMGGMGR